jgi:hypothetical protein
MGSSQLERVVGTASAFVGMKESPPGSNNVLFNTNYYGREVSGSSYPWCAAFLWDVFRLSGAQQLYYGGEKTASCTTLMNFAKSNGLFHDSGFRRGDIALFSFNGNKNVATHAGLVAEAAPTFVRSIEGNTALDNDTDGGAVLLRTRSNSVVIGTYRPQYEDGEPDGYAEFCANMERYMLLAGTGESHSDWADEAAEFFTKNGIILGDGLGGFGWKKPITREAAAKIIYGTVKLLQKG